MRVVVHVFSVAILEHKAVLSPSCCAVYKKRDSAALLRIVLA